MTSFYSDWDDVPLVNPLEESAAILGISRSATYRLIRSGKLDAIKVSQRRLLVTKAALRKFLRDEHEADQREQAPVGEPTPVHGLDDLGTASDQEGGPDVC